MLILPSLDSGFVGTISDLAGVSAAPTFPKKKKKKKQWQLFKQNSNPFLPHHQHHHPCHHHWDPLPPQQQWEKGERLPFYHRMLPLQLVARLFFGHMELFLMMII